MLKILVGHFRLGMVHDGYGNNCDKGSEEGKVMAATVQANFNSLYWTSCSRRSLERYIGFVSYKIDTIKILLDRCKYFVCDLGDSIA